MLKLIKGVYWVQDGRKRRIFKTKRAPTRYYYLADGKKRVYVNEKDVTEDMKHYITY